MALLNNLYIFVEKESITEDIESTSHPVEKGIDITDTIRRSPTTISLSGYIVKVDNVKTADAVTQIRKLKNNGSLIKYNSGTEIYENMQIQSFQRDKSYEVWGGYGFSMELKEVRIAKSSYTPPKKTTSTTTKPANTSKDTTIKAGSTVVFKGGNVYASSDAKKAAAKRNKSTCKVEIPNSKSSPIRTESWAIHPYHLVSTDGGKVYGWVDKANIEGVKSTSTTAKTNGGTQQVNSKSGTAVYHTVKKGDTVYKLVTKNYKSLGKTCQWVIDNNPHAFSRKGDATTLQVGKKLLMGYKK